MKKGKITKLECGDVREVTGDQSVRLLCLEPREVSHPDLLNSNTEPPSHLKNNKQSMDFLNKVDKGLQEMEVPTTMFSGFKHELCSSSLVNRVRVGCSTL